MESISSYIKSNDILKDLDFVTVYSTIIELLKDGKVVINNDVQIHEQQPEKQQSW